MSTVAGDYEIQGRITGQPATTVTWANSNYAPLMFDETAFVLPVVRPRNTSVEKKIRRRGWGKQFFEK